MVDFEFTDEQLSEAVQDLRAFADASYEAYPEDIIPVFDIETGEEVDRIDIIYELMREIINAGLGVLQESVE